MAKKLNASVARLLIAIAIILQILYIVTSLLSLITVKVHFNSPGEFLYGILSKLAIFIVILISLFFLLIDYRILKTTERSLSKARDYSLVFGAVEIVLGLVFLPTLVSGVFLLLAWLSLEL